MQIKNRSNHKIKIIIKVRIKEILKMQIKKIAPMDLKMMVQDKIKNKSLLLTLKEKKWSKFKKLNKLKKQE